MDCTDKGSSGAELAVIDCVKRAFQKMEAEMDARADCVHV